MYVNVTVAMTLYAKYKYKEIVHNEKVNQHLSYV